MHSVGLLSPAAPDHRNQANGRDKLAECLWKAGANVLGECEHRFTKQTKLILAK